MLTASVGEESVVRQDWLERVVLARLSRADFVKRGVVVAGGVAGLGALSPTVAFGKPKHDEPRPIPGGFADDFSTVPVDPFIHVLPPIVGFELSTITDFDGVVGAAEIQGTAHDTSGGTYWFDADMRFMKGRYVDLDGDLRAGVFGFVWIDLFQGPRGDLANSTQIHDFEPGIADSGLFWTIPISPESVYANAHSGRARYRMDNLKIPDYHDFGNAVSPNPTTTPARVSFDVSWTGGGDRTKLEDPLYDFTGDFVTGEATISFRARNDNSDLEFSSDPGGQVTVGPPGVGKERNGVFYP